MKGGAHLVKDRFPIHRVMREHKLDAALQMGQ
jgi:hypothetical protein